MITKARVLDQVTEILKDAERPMVAREITAELNRRGIAIEKMFLNQILWNGNDRPELVVDKATFQWRLDAAIVEEKAAMAARDNQAAAQATALEQVSEFLNGMGFEFLGVRREGSPKPFFFLRNDGDCVWLVGPTGNLLKEKSALCSEPEEMLPSFFTKEQITKAADEIMKQRQREFVDESRRIIVHLRDTELLAAEVYQGPVVERVTDSIPIDAVIFVAHVSRFMPESVMMAWGSALFPVYLVVNLLGYGMTSDERYGVFKISVYEILKRKLFEEKDGMLELKLHFERGQVLIRNGSHALALSI